MMVKWEESLYTSVRRLRLAGLCSAAILACSFATVACSRPGAGAPAPPVAAPAPPVAAAPPPPVSAPPATPVSSSPADSAGKPDNGSHMAGMMASMSHDTMSEASEEIPAGDPVPTIALHEQGPSQNGWAFRVTTNLTLSSAAGPYRPMHGHVHVYVDGVETMMIVTPQFTLHGLKPGTHTVRVVIAGTDHKTLLHDGAPIADSRTVTVPPAR